MYKDKNGNDIDGGMTVIVPDPIPSDLHSHSFAGIVTGVRHGNIVVLDGDGDHFEIEPNRLEVVANP